MTALWEREGLGPRHVAVIADGNGRWAAQRGLPRLAGHRAGMVRVNDVILDCLDARVERLSLFLFSTENWDRDEDEVRGIFALLLEFVATYQSSLHARGVRFEWIGRRSQVPAALHDALTRWERLPGEERLMTVGVCVDYGGRHELATAAGRLAADAVAGRIHPADIDEHALAGRLLQPELPDVDLLVRTSGEQRISNFLLWQAAYAELYFSEVLWPDFDRDALHTALSAYGARQRRFGRIP